MRYTDEVIEEVREKNDIVDVISQYVRLQRKGSSYFGLCPFHNEKSPSFSVSPDKQMFYCFGCGKGGNVFTFLMEYENYTFQESIRFLADRAGVKLPEEDTSREAQARSDRRSRLLEINKKAAEFYFRRLRTPGGEVGMNYLKGRGLSDETIRGFGLGYSGKYSGDLYKFLKQQGYPDALMKDSGLFSYDEKRGFTDKFWNRVMFPIMDANSRVIGFGGRVMGDAKPKYLNSPETEIFDKSRNLYGLNVARRSRRKNLIICEGYMDVIAMHQAGWTNAVASLGTALTSQQCALLNRFTKEVLVIYDMDGAGTKAALRAIPMLREAGLNTKVVNLRPHKDPDEFIRTEGPEAFEKRLEEAENSFLFVVRSLENDYNMNDPGERSAFFHEVSKKLLELPDEIERTSYVEAVASRYRIDSELLTRQINKEALRGVGRTEASVPKKMLSRSQIKEENKDKEQKLMLTWLTEWPQLIPRMKDLLSPEDFTNAMYREVAELAWVQAEKTGKISPAVILNHFEDSESQTEAASLFNTHILLDGDEEKRKAFFDVYCKMKRKSLDTRSKTMDLTDMQGFMAVMDERRKLDQLIAAGLPEDLFRF
ncbi:MAG: DNA primase [Eubacteriales bacterium]|nr:DNA primase [Eubacteriales bacterium]